MANKIQLRRGAVANLPTLSAGEPAFCTDTKQLFIGDGTTNIDLSATHISDRYSASKTYAVGAYCIYNNLLFKCTTAITVAEAWNATKWTLTTVTNELSKPTILWTNPSPLAQFASQVVSIVGSLSNYESYEILYALTPTSDSYVLRSGKIPVGRTTVIGTSSTDIIWRAVSSINDNSLTFAVGFRNPLNGGATYTDNGFIIPLNVIGYK